MRLSEAIRPLVVIVGPTAVGKTEVALEAAERLGGEIISADSRYFYRGMDIGTAKPSLLERARVPHHLIDVADPDETWSLSVFRSAAQEAIAGVHERGKLPLLVGGTGQYIHAVTENWEMPEQPPDFQMRAILEEWAKEIGVLALHQRLAVIDPQAAVQIEPNNVRRTIRALEVIFHTGRMFSEQRKKSESIYSLLQIGLTRPRAELYARVDARIGAMLANGLLDEVRNLVEKGYGPELPTMSAIGYREMGAVLRGEMTLDDAIAQMKRLTRIFVRRQANWFRESDPRIRWFDMRPGVSEEIVQFILSSDAWQPPKK